MPAYLAQAYRKVLNSHWILFSQEGGVSTEDLRLTDF